MKITDGIRNALGRLAGSHDGPKTTATTIEATQINPMKQRVDSAFGQLMQEVEELGSDHPTIEEKAEYGWITGVRFLLPVVLFLSFGYEDGLFMTGFRYLSLEPFIVIMYTIGYSLEALRVALVFSMSFSQSEQRPRARRSQLIFWVVRSLGCGIAQLAAAVVIQALGADSAVTGNNVVAHGASLILARIPFLVYVAIAIRVGLCAVADLACSGFLHKKKETMEQKVSKVTTKASNFQTLLQAHNNAQTMIDNAEYFRQIVADERLELSDLRQNQKQLFAMVFQAGMSQFNIQIGNPTSQTPQLPAGNEEE
jgi:hypothetical protein